MDPQRANIPQRRTDASGTTVYEVYPTQAAAYTVDSVRWGPVWAGLFSALAIFVALELLLFAIGWMAPSTGPTQMSTLTRSQSGISALAGLIAFFFGGWIAGANSSVRGTHTGAMNGFVVWALGTVVIMLLAGLGAVHTFGVASDPFRMFAIIEQMRTATISPALASAIQMSCLWGFVFLVLSALVCVAGCSLASRPQIPVTSD